MRTFLWLFGFAGLGLARGATFLADYNNSTNGAAITPGFIPDALQVMAGEPLFVTFTVSKERRKNSRPSWTGSRFSPSTKRRHVIGKTSS